MPPSPFNGYVQYTSTSVHSVATYHCNKRHKLLGFDSTTCLVGGRWSGVVPLCRSKDLACFTLYKNYTSIIRTDMYVYR